MGNLNNSQDTIVAQATPPGRGGVSIVRVSGPLVPKITQAILGSELIPRQATFRSFRNQENTVLDEGLAVFFSNPNSFTGEDVLELHGHGGPIIVDLIIQEIVRLGARLARPGEFSERAFLNEKIDLAQAEAIADLIDASSAQAARLALRSLQGEFSKTIHALNEKIIHLRMYVEAAIDFTDEEIDFLSDEKISTALNDIIHSIMHIQTNAKQGCLLREGFTAVIMGEPNVGKSSLLNRLSGKDSAIVTDIPGTTRDVLREYILIDDIPMHLIDTAGLRESADIVEAEGIRRAYQEMQKADVILYVISSESDMKSLPKDLPKNKPWIIIKNKIDLTALPPNRIKENHYHVISLSAKTGAGIDLLKSHIKSIIGFQNREEGLYLARRRHLDALLRSQQYLQLAKQQLVEKAGELAAEDLRLAQQALCEITGEFNADDLLGHIFSNFCIGK